MPKIRVRHDLPSVEDVESIDVRVRDDGDELIGTMGITEDGLTWWIPRGQRPHSVSWAAFKDWMETHPR